MSKYILVPVEPTDEMLAEGVTAASEAGWQPIETAPMDGAEVLLYYGEDYYVMEGKCFPIAFQGRGSPYKWVTAVDMGDLKPTHWMPLPLPPKEC